jgi:FkbM family methyltransferase
MKSIIAEARRHLRPVKRIAQKVGLWSRGGDLDRYLVDFRGVIHVGANRAQEKDKYASHSLRVVWVEAIPSLHQAIVRDLSNYKNQRAIQALITDRDCEDCVLHVASNDGASSSIFELSRHREIWPEVKFSSDLKLKSSTLPAALASAGIDVAEYDALVLDIQGAELKALKGARPLLRSMKYIQTEGADFESYEGGATVSELVGFLGTVGFRLARKERFAGRTGVGFYYELLFRRSD